MALNTHPAVAVVVVAGPYEYFARLRRRLPTCSNAIAAQTRRPTRWTSTTSSTSGSNCCKDNPDAREHYQRRFQFILVDEYQDTNNLQSELIDLLAGRHKNVMVVGDDSQSIYSWRGANFQNILEFPKRYAGAKIYKIETNYRSTPEILNVANAAIAANIRAVREGTHPGAKSGAKPVLVTCGTATEQAAFIAQRVLELREEGVT